MSGDSAVSDVKQAPTNFPNEGSKDARQAALNIASAEGILTFRHLNLEGVALGELKAATIFESCKGVRLKDKRRYAHKFNDCTLTLDEKGHNDTSHILTLNNCTIFIGEESGLCTRLRATACELHVGKIKDGRDIPRPHRFVDTWFEKCNFHLDNEPFSLQFEGCRINSCCAAGTAPVFWTLQNNCHVSTEDTDKTFWEALGDTLLYAQPKDFRRAIESRWLANAVELTKGLHIVARDLRGLHVASNSQLSHGCWESVRLSYAKLQGCDLSKSKLENCELTGTDLTDANLADCSTSGNHGRHTILTGVHAAGANLSGMVIEDVEVNPRKQPSVDGKDGRLIADHNTVLSPELEKLGKEHKIYERPDETARLPEVEVEGILRPQQLNQRRKNHGQPPSHAPRGDDQPTRATHRPPLLFPTSQIRALVAAMLTRPMVLLAGISGSGKTQLARRIGAAYAAGHFGGGTTVDSVLTSLHQHDVLSATDTADMLHVHDVPEANLVTEHAYAFTSVRSDWTDATHLWGYLLPIKERAEFHATETLRVFLAGQSDTALTPRFVLLDEMNLARPEHYGSDLLSAMEVIGDTSATGG